jgi:acyl-coenzyme A thioesterase PaaI-like protein
MRPPDDAATLLGEPEALPPAPAFSNQLRRAEQLVRWMPRWLRRHALTFAFRNAVPFFGAARAHIESVSEREVVVRVADRRQVRNHVRGVHAIAMALSAETATGLLVAMNLQDRVVPLLVKMSVDYVHRSNGDLVARAWLTPEQARDMQTSPRGETMVAVEVTDESGTQPIVCEMVWAWRHLGARAPRKKKHRHQPGARLLDPERKAADEE